MVKELKYPSLQGVASDNSTLSSNSIENEENVHIPHS
jgi:hypothetical protein